MIHFSAFSAAAVASAAALAFAAALTACADVAVADSNVGTQNAAVTFAPRSVQFFQGTVTTSSLDGATPFGAPVPSLVRRVVDPAASRVIEEVHQRGQTFVTILKRVHGELDTADNLVFTAADTAGSFHGIVTFADQALSAWSYDLEVTSPTAGHLGGSLPGDGARIDPVSGVLTVRKIFSDKVLVREEYQPITERAYEDALAALVP
jgi:hypothetical protein